MSHLHDLYKRRQDTRHRKEDFTSTALAWLLQRDQIACRLLLDELGITAPADLSRRVVHTQVRLRGCQKRPDLMIEVLTPEGQRRIYVECKLDLPVDDGVRDQVADYAARTRCPVGLLCLRGKLPAPKDPAWSTAPYRGSWEGFTERLEAASAQVDPDAVPLLRREFMALAKDLGFGTIRQLTDADVTRAMQAQAHMAAWEAALRDTLRGLLPADAPDAEDPWTWQLDGPLYGSWARDRAPRGFGLSGLGLHGEPVRVGDAVAVGWTVELCASTTVAREHKEVLEGPDWTYNEHGWWESELAATALDPEMSGEEALRLAVAELRLAVQQDLQISLPEPGRMDAPVLARPLSSMTRGLEDVDFVARRLSGSSKVALEAMLKALERRVPGTARPSQRGRSKIFLEAVEGGPRSAGAWPVQEPGRAQIGIWIWPGGRAVADAVRSSFRETLGAPGAYQVGQDGSGDVLHLFVDVLPVATLDARIAQAAEVFAKWVAKHKKTLSLR